MKKKIIILFGLCCCVVCVLINNPIVYILFASAVVLAAANIFVFNKNRFWAKNINNLNVIGRNYDTLIIGEPIDKTSLGLPADNKTISIVCPGRSRGASILLAYRLFSLLRPKGTLIITSHNNGKRVTSLDIPYIHDVTLLEMGIDKRKQYLPLVFNPLMSLKVAINVVRNVAQKGKNDQELEKFCITRNIKLLTYQV